MSGTRPFRPREHGAYAMLAFPVASGLLVGGVSVAGVCFAALGVVGFLAHEPALVAMGRRGERLRLRHRTGARSWLLGLGLTGGAAAVVFAWQAPPAAWTAAAATGIAVSVLALLVAARRSRTPVGELVVGAAFALLHAGVAACGGAGPRGTWIPAAVWAVSFGLATVAVHALKHRFKGRGPGGWAVVAAPLAAVLVLVPSIPGGTDTGWAVAGLALLPKSLVILGLSVARVHPGHLMRVGWSLVATDTVTLVLLAVLVG